MVVYDPVDGVQVYPEGSDEAAQAAETLIGKIKADEKPSLEGLTRHLAAVARPKENVRAAFVIDSASRIARTPTDLEPPSATSSGSPRSCRAPPVPSG